jgi:dihydrofolate synthase/folylpolyglutamate synthase
VDYDESLRWLLGLPDFERTGDFADRPDLRPMRALLAELGDPHTGRPTVHVAGSKGKGSTSVMVEGVLRAAGARTGCYISPHLHRFNERIRIDAAPCPPDAFAAAMTAVRAAAERVALLFDGRQFLAFDALTAAAFVAFRDAGVGAQVIEVGLGGRLDSTNVFQADGGGSDVCVVTPISLEHTAILGSTIPEIAREKAGIITAGCTVVVAPQRESALDVVREVARSRAATVVEVAAVCQLTRVAHNAGGQDFRLQTPRAAYAARLPLVGRHQLDNAAAAIVACEELAGRHGLDLTPAHVRDGLAGVAWAARIETLKRRPLVIVDGAHNGDSAKRLAAALREHFGLARATLLFGTLAGKDIDAIAAAMAPMASAVYVAAWPSVRAAEPSLAAAAFRPYDAPVYQFGSLAQAYDAAEAEAGERGAIVAFGAIAFAAAVREYLLGIESDMIRLASTQSPAEPAR